MFSCKCNHSIFPKFLWLLEFPFIFKLSNIENISIFKYKQLFVKYLLKYIHILHNPWFPFGVYQKIIYIFLHGSFYLNFCGKHRIHTGEFTKRVQEMSFQLFVTPYTLSIYPSAH